VDSLPAEVGSTVELGDVLLIASNGDVRVGHPTVEGARVIAEVVEHGRDRKIVVFKYKAKTRYRRRRGHRQGYTRLAVRQILTAEGVLVAEEKPKRRAPAKAAAKPARRPRKAEPVAEAPVVEVPPEAPETEAKPARRTRAPKLAAEAVPEAAAEMPEAEAKPARRTRAPKPAAEAAPEAAVETPEAEAKPARRTRARKAEPEASAETEKPKRTRKKTETE